jgi:hypothetical protein
MNHMVQDGDAPHIFVWATGQDDNIGDVVLRRAEFDFLRELGSLHLFLGPASPRFVEALRLGPWDQTYTEHEAWWSAYREQSRSHRTLLVDKPGELQMNLSTLRRRATMIPTSRAARRKGGRLAHFGVGIRTWDARLGAPFRLAYRTADLLYWRDTASLERFRYGALMPDWAFAEAPLRNVDIGSERPSLVVSLRSDRPKPSPAWLSTVRQFADEQDLELAVVTQVGRDSARSVWLAEALHARRIDWLDTRSHANQERVLREAYQRARIVLSDRLHVLIIGAIEGASPLCVTEWHEGKVGRHFEAIGLADVSTAFIGEQEFTRLLHRAKARHGDVNEAVESARRSVHGLYAELAGIGFARRLQDG